MSLKSAFDNILSMHQRSATLVRRNATGVNTTGALKMSPSNYFRKLSAPGDAIIEGREFVITKSNLLAAGFSTLRRGDIIQDAEIGECVIDEIREMYDIGGAILGYRVTTS